MSKNPNESKRMPAKGEDLDRDVQEQKHEKQAKQKHHKPTVQFDKGQKFTSDEDIIRKSA
jgi:hypothetical protein